MKLTRVFVEHLELEASIGVLDRETVTTQPLLVDIAMVIESGATKTGRLETTVDYRTAVDHARHLVARGHILLVEDFAEELAATCLKGPKVVEVTVRATKPDAIASARAAGVEITRSKR